MPVEFTITDQSIIKNMMLQKSAKEISKLLDCKTQDVLDFMKIAVHGTNIVTCQMKLDAKRPLKKPVKKKQKDNSKLQLKKLVEERKKEKVKRLQMDEERKRSRRPPTYKSKEVDYSQLITVRIDAKTFIYAKPGDDIEKLKANFLKTYKSK